MGYGPIASIGWDISLDPNTLSVFERYEVRRFYPTETRSEYTVFSHWNRTGHSGTRHEPGVVESNCSVINTRHVTYKEVQILPWCIQNMDRSRWEYVHSAIGISAKVLYQMGDLPWTILCSCLIIQKL